MTAKHTPGPWKATHQRSRSYVQTADAVDLAACEAVNHGNDARLIAAAPELLGALKAIVANDFNMTEGARRIIRAAIAKAEGAP